MKSQRWMVYAVVIGIILSLFFLAGVAEPKEDQEYIRFHVIANSDDPEDQALKLRVRDKLLERFHEEFAGIDSIDLGREKIIENLEEIREIAQAEVRESGKSYPVTAQLGHFDFPTKAYGELVLPAGNYEALRVVIGTGGGKNWWCVMFPPLCFVDITHGIAKTEGVPPQKVEGDGLTELSVQDEELIQSLNSREVPIEYRLKILEWFQSSKFKRLRMLSFLDTWMDEK